MTVIMATGGSTNAVLHLIAMAKAVDVDLTLDDFQRISDRSVAHEVHTVLLVFVMASLLVVCGRFISALRSSKSSQFCWFFVLVILYDVYISTPFISDLRPSGKYVMEDLHYVGGISALMKMLHAEGYIHGDCMYVHHLWLTVFVPFFSHYVYVVVSAPRHFLPNI